jgi:hypothetical protein
MIERSHRRIWRLVAAAGMVLGATVIIPVGAAPPAAHAAAPVNGYRIAVADGGTFTYGAGVNSVGSANAIALNRPIVAVAATPSGHGYWLVASDGGIFSFGDAKFRGSTGGLVLNRPIVGMASTPSGNGYWLVASDGGIFNFGDAPFFGSAGSASGGRRIVGMAPATAGGTSAQGDFASQVRTYRGTMTIAVDYYDFCDISTTQRQYRGTRTGTFNVTIVTGPRKTNFRSPLPLVETNPFNLFVQTTPVGQNGGVDLSSAGVFAEDRIMLQYWALQLRGSTLTGNLIDTHAAETAVLNEFWTDQLFLACAPQLGGFVGPLTVSTGATLQGTITDRRIAFDVQGTVDNRTRDIRATFVATR